jgi:hypothetical protein
MCVRKNLGCSDRDDLEMIWIISDFSVDWENVSSHVICVNQET